MENRWSISGIFSMDDNKIAFSPYLFYIIPYSLFLFFLPLSSRFLSLLANPLHPLFTSHFRKCLLISSDNSQFFLDFGHRNRENASFLENIP